MLITRKKILKENLLCNNKAERPPLGGGLSAFLALV
jgi:hypothetical protein